MKSRTEAREFAVRLVFELGYNYEPITEFLSDRMSAEFFGSHREDDELYRSPPDDAQSKYIRRVLEGVDEHWPEIDGYIERHAIGWTIERMSRMTAAVLRVCIYEILYMPDIPDSAAINAAVDIARKYESSESATFINGILGAFWRFETGGKK